MEIGNNIVSKNFYRCVVPLISETNNSFNIQGKYYFPELKNLQNKKINGITVHYGSVDITTKTYITYGDKTLFFLSPTGFTGLDTFLTLYDIDGNELVSNMPTSILQNGATGKIIPFNAYLNIKKSYVLVPQLYVSTPPIIPALTLTFFHD